MKNLISKMVTIQSELKAPKNQFNSFGKYKYRSCEDIIEAVKPLLAENGLYLNINDSIIEVGGKNYVQAVATIYDGENQISSQAVARESVDKKGMDDAQQTGATSSYARKYALNGLFGIDDTKDADATNLGTAEKSSIPTLDGSNAELNTAIYNVKLAKVNETLKNIWDNNKKFQSEKLFIEAINIRKKELNG